MIKVNSISGGKTSAYLMANYPANINVFALVRVEDKELLWMKGKDEKTRQLVSDKIGEEFIGTVEQDEIIYTLLDLEQYTGQGINWVTGETFEKIIENHGGYLPNQMVRYCTTELKIIPIFNFLNKTVKLPVEMNIGYRYETNEISRSKRMLSNCDDGLEKFKTVVGKSKNGNRNKWGFVDYRYPKFPLIDDVIMKDVINNYWKDKPVRFAYRNNCVGCVNRQPLFLSHMANKDPESFNWFVNQEEKTGNKFRKETTYKRIKEFGVQNVLFDDDFNDCDSGYCGI